MRTHWMLVLLILIVASPAYALTYSDVPPEALPVINIYNPYTRTNEPITHFSYEELDDLMLNAQFRTWNDLPDVCLSMQMMFGHASPHCGSARLIAPLTPATARAYVDFTIIAPPEPMMPPQLVILTDPLTPPWAPTWDY